jgi:hypothetical protein
MHPPQFFKQRPDAGQCGIAHSHREHGIGSGRVLAKKLVLNPDVKFGEVPNGI